MYYHFECIIKNSNQSYTINRYILDVLKNTSPRDIAETIKEEIINSLSDATFSYTYREISQNEYEFNQPFKLY